MELHIAIILCSFISVAVVSQHCGIVEGKKGYINERHTVAKGQKKKKVLLTLQEMGMLLLNSIKE